MTITEAIPLRHSVRNYLEKPISEDAITALKDEIARCNSEGELHLQLVIEEPKAFSTKMAHYGKFSGVRNYITLVGRKGNSLDERLGYYGERIVLLAQTLGLNTCWVGLTYGKVPDAFTIDKDESLEGVIAIGYGASQGVQHRSKSIEEVATLNGNEPQWFTDGVKAALLAPTAVNQQKFRFAIGKDGKVSAKAGIGFFAKMDLGIVKYHFEIGANKENFEWE